MGGERITRQSIKKAKFSWRHPRVSLIYCAEQYNVFLPFFSLFPHLCPSPPPPVCYYDHPDVFDSHGDMLFIRNSWRQHDSSIYSMLVAEVGGQAIYAESACLIKEKK